MGQSMLSEKRLIPSAGMHDRRDSIPTDWSFVSIKEIAASRANAIVGGPFGSDLVSKDYVWMGVPVIRGQNMARHYISGDFAFVSPGKAKQLQANTARAGDIIFTQRGTLGQVSLVPAAPFDEYVVSQSQMKLELNARKASAEYIYQYFVSAEGKKQIVDSAIQTGVPHTNLGILKKYEIPCPPTLREQEAIGEALSDADALIDSLSLLLSKKRQIKQGAMRELLTGRKRLPGFQRGWVECPFNSIAALRRERVSPHTMAAPPRCIELEHIRAGSGCLEGQGFESAQVAIKTVFVKGDVLFGKLRAYLRKYWLAEFDGVCSTEIWALRPTGVLKSNAYLFYTVQRDDLVEAASSAYGTHMPRSDWSVVGAFLLHVPEDEAEQKAIADVLSEMDASIAAIEACLVKARDMKRAMMQQLLTGRIRLVQPASNVKLSRAGFANDDIAGAVADCRTVFNG